MSPATITRSRDRRVSHVHSTEANKPPRLTEFTPAMQRLCDLRVLAELQSEADVQWKALAVLAWQEGQHPTFIAWAAGRPLQNNRVYRVLKKAEGIDLDSPPELIRSRSQALPVPEELSQLPDLSGLHHLIRTDPGTKRKPTEKELAEFAERSDEVNMPSGLIWTPALEALYKVSELWHLLDDLRPDVKIQSNQLIMHTFQEKYPITHIAWALGRPTQPKVVYEVLRVEFGIDTETASGHRIRRPIEPKPLPKDLKSLPGLKDLAVVLDPNWSPIP